MLSKNWLLWVFTKQKIVSLLIPVWSMHSKEAVAQKCSVKKVFLKISENSQENPCLRPAILLNTGVLLWILRKLWDTFFTEHLRTTASDSITLFTIKNGILIVFFFKFFTKISRLLTWQAEACKFTKKETPTQVLSCEFYEFFKNTFLKEHFRWLLLCLSC